MAAASLLWLGVLIDCSSKASFSGKGASKVVAKIDDRAITLADVEQQIPRQAPSVPRDSLARKKTLDGLVRFELMALEAERLGYNKDPEVVRLVKQEMISQFIQHEINSKYRAEDVSESEAHKYYVDHASAFMGPPKVRVSHILVKSKQKADMVAAAAKALAPADILGFTKLVATHSEDAQSRERDGDLGDFARRQGKLPAALADAAFSLTNVNDVSAPIATDEGFHVLKLIRKVPAAARPYSEVEREVRARVAGNRREEMMRNLITQAGVRHKVEIFEDRLSPPAKP